MALRTPETKNEQDAAYNPSQEYYDSEFNKIASANQTAEDLKNKETNAGDIDAIERYANSPQNATDNIDKTKEKEERGWQTNVKGQEKPDAKDKKGSVSGRPKKGPVAFTIALIFGMGGLSFAGIPFMPVTIMEHFTNDGNDPSPSVKRKGLSLFGGKANGSDFRKKLSICTKLVSFRCKMKTIPEPLADRFEKEGKFKFHNKTVMSDGRIGFSAIEFPSGEIAQDSGQLKRILATSRDASIAFSGVYNIKNSIFNIGDFFPRAIGVFNLTKGKKIQGETKDEARKSFEESARGERGRLTTSAVPSQAGENATEEEKKRAQAETESGNETSRQINNAIAKGTKLEKLDLKVGRASALPQLACLTYNMANVIAVTAKIKKAMYFAGFAMIFLTLASTIKANVATSAEVETAMEVLAPSKYPEKVEDPATGQMIDNPNIGKNALDAEAYKVVAYGDQINLTGIAMKFFVAGGFLGTLQKVLTWIDEKIGKSNIQTACKITNSVVFDVISFLAAPIIAGIGIIADQLLPIDEWAADLVNLAIDAVTGFDPKTDIIGADAGNVLFIGTLAIMGATSMKFGLKPGSLAAIKKNMAENQEILNEEIALETYKASKTPFDITNRYSFLGSMAFQLASLMPTVQQPIASSMNKLLAAVPKSFGMLTMNANAAYSMPVADYSETRFNQCKDEVYAAFKDKFKPDMFCAIRYVPHDPVEPDPVFDYLEATNQIDKVTAEPIAGSYADKYMKYCVNRTDPWGSTSVAAEEQADDAKWYTGEMCFEDTKDNQMVSEYVGYKVMQETMDKYPKATESKNPTNEQAFYDGESSVGQNNSGLSQTLSLAVSSMLGGAH